MKKFSSLIAFLFCTTLIVLACGTLPSTNPTTNPEQSVTEVENSTENGNSVISPTEANTEVPKEYSIGITWFGKDGLGNEIPAGWTPYYASVWLRIDSRTMDYVGIIVDEEVDVRQLAPLESGKIGAYVETQEGVNYPVDITLPTGTPSGIPQYVGTTTIGFNSPLSKGVPFTGAWAGQFFPVSPITARFLVPDSLHPTRLVFPNLQTSIDLPSIDTGLEMPIVSSSDFEILPSTLQITENTSLAISKPHIRVGREFATLIFPASGINEDKTAQHDIYLPQNSLIDSHGLLWQQENDCSFPYSVGPGLTAEGEFCFTAKPYFEVYSALPDYFVLTTTMTEPEIAKGFLIPINEVVIDNCQILPVDSMEYSSESYSFFPPKEMGDISVPSEVTSTTVNTEAESWRVQSKAGQQVTITISNDQDLYDGLMPLLYGSDGQRMPYTVVSKEEDVVDKIIVNPLCDGYYYLVINNSTVIDTTYTIQIQGN